jgi:hypothetical protein
MAARVAAIHDFGPTEGKTWMPGTSPRLSGLNFSAIKTGSII